MILKKIFQKKQSIFQKIFSGIGLGVGLFLVLMSIHIHTQINQALQHKNNASEYITISKQISMGNTLFLQKNDFSPKELTQLQEQPFVEKIGVFMPNQFSVVAFAKEVGFMSELFFESVEDEYLDIAPKKFVWKQGDEIIPIILAKEMLDLYNFGFALGKGMPQISESTAKLVTINIQISGKNTRQLFKARIVGFTQRFSTILVPNSFMKWANEKIGEITEQPNPARVIIKTNNPADKRISDYFSQKNYAVNEQNMAIAQTGGIVQIIMIVLGSIGFVFMLLAFVIMVLQFNIILAEAKPEIVLLLQIGYLPFHILKVLGKEIAIFLAIIGFLVSMGVYTASQYINSMLETRGLMIENTTNFWIFFVEFLLIFTLFVIQMWQTKRIVNGEL